MNATHAARPLGKRLRQAATEGGYLALKWVFGRLLLEVENENG
jgi:hypothetical protein